TRFLAHVGDHHSAALFQRLGAQSLLDRESRARWFHFVGRRFDDKIVSFDFVNADPAVFAGALHQLGNLLYHAVSFPAGDDRRADFLKRPAFAIAPEGL